MHLNRTRQIALSELKETFFAVLRNYTLPETTINVLWSEVDRNYSDKKRHYHTLYHLASVLAELLEVKTEIQHWQTVLFTVYYHDIIYDPLRSDNEEKSAELAAERMQQIGVANDQTKVCREQILATKSHTSTVDGDTNYFTDADLSILGQSWDVYSEYNQNIRKEFSIYPDAVYYAGRRKVLHHFLGMDRIFKTDYFFKKFEATARHNLKREMQLLNDTEP
jgi:predicted metal-dependent HD superfamily phosphohydrolase